MQYILLAFLIGKTSYKNVLAYKVKANNKELWIPLRRVTNILLRIVKDMSFEYLFG